MKKTVSTTTTVLCLLGIIFGCFIFINITNFTRILLGKRDDIEHIAVKPCDPEICGLQCYDNYYTNAWCENFLCYCDNDCERHRRLYPWDDVTATCAHLCNHKHGPCTGSGCANDSYWVNSTHAEYDLYWNKTTWFLEPNNTRWIFEHFFFNSTTCLCYDNITEEEHTTEVPSSSEWLIGFPLDSSEEYSKSSQGNSSKEYSESSQENSSEEYSESSQGDTSEEYSESSQENSSEEYSESTQGDSSEEHPTIFQGNSSEEYSESSQGDTSEEYSGSAHGNRSEKSSASSSGHITSSTESTVNQSSTGSSESDDIS